MQHMSSHIIRKKVRVEDMSDFLEVHSYLSLIVGDGPDYLSEGKIDANMVIIGNNEFLRACFQ